MQYWLHQLALELEERLTKDRDVVSRIHACIRQPSSSCFSPTVSKTSLQLLSILQNGRVAKSLTVGVCQLGDKRQSSYSRCCALVRYDAAKISSDSFAIIKSLNTAGNHQESW